MRHSQITRYCGILSIVFGLYEANLALAQSAFPPISEQLLPSITWANVLDSGQFEQGRVHDGVELYNDNLLVVGSITFQDKADVQAWIGAFDPNGNRLWEKHLGNPNGDESLSRVVQLQNGDFLATGYTNSYGSGNLDALLVRFDHLGNILQERTIGTANLNRLDTLIATTDGGALVGGTSMNAGNLSSDAWLVKLNANGGITWQKFYRALNYANINSILALPSGDYLVAGATLNNSSSGNGLLLRLSSTGNIIWQRQINNGQILALNDVLQVGNRIITIGYTGSAGYRDLFAAAFDLQGQILWQKQYGQSSDDILPYRALRVGTRGVMLTAYEGTSGGSLYANIMLIELNEDGVLRRAKSFGQNFYRFHAPGLIQTADQGFLLMGYAYTGGILGTWSEDFLMLKTTRYGDINACSVVANASLPVTNTNFTISAATIGTPSSMNNASLINTPDIGLSSPAAFFCGP